MRRWVWAAVGVMGCAPQTEAWTPPDDGWQRHPERLRTAGEPAGDGQVEIVIADPSVQVDADGRWHLWYQGSRAPFYTSPDLEMWVRHAVSDDGIAFTVDAAPSLTTASAGWDATHTETPSVIEVPDADGPDRRWLMAYSGASATHPLGFPDYAIGVATSPDGARFTRQADAPAMDVHTALADVPGVTGGVVADPELVWDGERVHLFYSSFGHDADLELLAFGIGHAVSDDGGRTFTPDPAAPIASLLDPQGIGGQQPSVTFDPASQQWHMMFTADQDSERKAMPSTFNPAMGFWRATSEDLVTWAIDWDAGRDFFWSPEAPYERLGLLTGAALRIHDGEQRLYYTGWGDTDVPEGFVVPTHSGVEPAVLNLLLATRPAPR